MTTTWTKRTAVFLTGQTISLFGSSLVQFAISWHITLSTKSGLMMAISTLCGFLPQVLISLFGGVWADRFDRKKLIILADGTIAVFTALLAILFTLGYTNIWLLFVISAVRSLGAGIQTPAVSAFLTELVPQDKLMRVNGINASIQSVMMLLAPAAAGGLYNMMSLGSVFWVDLITAVAGIALLLALKVAKREKPEKAPEGFLWDLLSGIRYVTGTKWLRQFLGFYLIYAIMYGPVVFLTPLMVARSFGDESWRLVVHEMAFSIGSILGGVLVGWIGQKLRNKVHMLMWASVVFGLTTCIMGFSPNFWFYLGIMLPMGVTMPFVNTGAMTVLQIRTKQDMIGRVFGLVSIIGSGAMPLSMALFGPLSDAVSVELLLIVTGVLMMLICLATLLFKEMYAAGEPLPAEADPALTESER